MKVDWELSQEKTVVISSDEFCALGYYPEILPCDTRHSLEISLQGNRGRDARKGKGKGSLPGLEKINNRRLIGW